MPDLDIMWCLEAVYDAPHEAKYDLAVGHLLLQSFWANEAIFQLRMLTYNLFLLFKMDFTKEDETF